MRTDLLAATTCRNINLVSACNWMGSHCWMSSNWMSSMKICAVSAVAVILCVLSHLLLDFLHKLAAVLAVATLSHLVLLHEVVVVCVHYNLCLWSVVVNWVNVLVVIVVSECCSSTKNCHHCSECKSLESSLHNRIGFCESLGLWFELNLTLS